MSSMPTPPNPSISATAPGDASLTTTAAAAASKSRLNAAAPSFFPSPPDSNLHLKRTAAGGNACTHSSPLHNLIPQPSRTVISAPSGSTASALIRTAGIAGSTTGWADWSQPASRVVSVLPGIATGSEPPSAESVESVESAKTMLSQFGEVEHVCHHPPYPLTAFFFNIDSAVRAVQASRDGSLDAAVQFGSAGAALSVCPHSCASPSLTSVRPHILLPSDASGKHDLPLLASIVDIGEIAEYKTVEASNGSPGGLVVSFSDSRHTHEAAKQFVERGANLLTDSEVWYMVQHVSLRSASSIRFPSIPPAPSVTYGVESEDEDEEDDDGIAKVDGFHEAGELIQGVVRMALDDMHPPDRPRKAVSIASSAFVSRPSSSSLLSSSSPPPPPFPIAASRAMSFSSLVSSWSAVPAPAAPVSSDDPFVSTLSPPISAGSSAVSPNTIAPQLLAPSSSFGISGGDNNCGTGSGKAVHGPKPAAIQMIGDRSYEHAVTEENRISVALVRAGRETRTTVMVRNIPNKVTRGQFVEHHVNPALFGKIDFLYLRMDFKNSCNVGYGFVNFIRPLDVAAYVEACAGKPWSCFQSRKICHLSFASNQGLDELLHKFRNSVIMGMPDEWRPMLFYPNGPLKGYPKPWPQPTEEASLKDAAARALAMAESKPNGQAVPSQNPIGVVLTGAQQQQLQKAKTKRKEEGDRMRKTLYGL